MTTLREAAQQALEALEGVDGPITALLGSLLGSPDADAPGAKVRTAITALRDALAQQAEPVEPVEPVAWIESPHGAIRANPNYKFTFPSQLLHWQIPLYTAPPQQVAQQAEPLNLSDPAVRKRLASQWGYVPAAAQAEPVEPVEPVAVVATQSDVWRGYNGQWAPPGEPIKMVQMLRDLPMGTPLFTAPPQRLPLTEEEIVDAVREADLDWQAGWTLDEHAPNRFTTLVRAVERAHGIKE